MRILVTGANGQLGTEMRIVSKDSRDTYVFTDIDELDITNRDEVIRFVSENKIDVVVNCAAFTNVEKAEDEEAVAELINAKAVENIAIACQNNDATLIHISTDYVFGGNDGNTPRNEDEPVNPTGAYGRTKLHGEEALKKSKCKSIVIRTAWLYSEYGTNFVKTMRRLTAEKERVNVVFDQVGTPTYALDLAKVIFNIIEERKLVGNEGLYHYSNEGAISWYDFAKEICEQYGNSCDVQPCFSNELISKVKRPSYSVLDKSKIKNTFNINIPYWKDSLRNCIKNTL
ncbi:MAG: dTDP-4-dehydrorhamnose reductase [Candidatus Limimorpha sp.]